jgi:uncharacterized repeat protein (TIGR01451 family)
VRKLARNLRALARTAAHHRRATIIFGAAVVIVSVPAGIVSAGDAANSAGASAAASATRYEGAPGSKRALAKQLATHGEHVTVGHSNKNDVSRPLRQMPPVPYSPRPEREASPNPSTGRSHTDAPDGAHQGNVFAPRMPGTSLNFDGIPFPGVNCNCAPPDTNGEVGATQYVQIVNQGYQVFNKTTGASVFGPVDIATIWNGFTGPCEDDGNGDPVVLYDQLANRWVISQFAGYNDNGTVTDECVAVSTTSDATGSYNRYDFDLSQFGNNFYDYPKLGVWPDAYYMSMNVFNAAGTAYLGPQAFALDRTSMLAGNQAAIITPGITNGPTEDPYLPADLDGSTPPPVNAPNPFVEFPGNQTYKVYRFHVDWVTPANSTFTLAGSPSAAAFTLLCPTGPCVPQLGTNDKLDALGDRLMFRAAYRNFGGHESLVSNYSVSSNGVAGVRWFELRSVTSGTPTKQQESTYQPDNTWRWMGSAAMDVSGDLAVGFSASSAAIHPKIRYAGRLAGDPINTLARGEATLYGGTGSQTDTNSRWGDYSDLTVDPVDNCTFWYTNEYYSSTSSFNWRTRIGKFKFAGCGSPSSGVFITKTADAASVDAGSQIGFTVSLTNDGDAQATNLSVSDALPAGNGVDWTLDNANSDLGWTIVGSPPNESLHYSPTTLDAGTSTHVHVVSNTTTASAGTYDNTASFTTADGSGSDSATTTVQPGPACSLAQGFDDVTHLPGWFMQNNSEPLGPTGWSQGDPAAFTAQSGAANSYVEADYFNNGDSGTISNWLVTPQLLLQNGTQLTFYTRTIFGSPFPDRLQVRMSTNGASSNVGSAAEDVGDFTTLLLDVNPTEAQGGYPESWTPYTATVSGVPTQTVGRLAFRYYVHDGGPNGSRSLYIGIDTASYSCTPPPPPPPPPPPAHWTLNVFKAGAGAGTVASSPSGVNCGPVCTWQFDNGTSVTLTETPSSSSKFAGWSGACSGTATTCVLSMTADRNVTATFAKKPKCKVPKVVGLTLAKAKAKIRKAHCGVGKIRKKVSSRKKKGHVLSQKPKPGKTLPAGSKVNLTVGKGPKH